ncbi:MAG: alpha/beta hydrolase [Holophagales bacterium]|nr:alpha/beta hydrolase [Holophagales bacterium]MYH25023.1 alpha/beta hydrolase [Holophagales bacterium]
MAERPVVMIHGWSATSEGLEPLARLVRAQLGAEISIVRLADYLSMEDEVRFDDLVSAMDRAWDAEGLPRTTGGVDALVHSTGGPVIRDWLDRNFAPGDSPVGRLVMLAPANFGSPLAHKGRSLIARALKGFIAKKPEGRPFETGTQILKGLELASPYTWNLAGRDRFGEGGTRYQPGNVLCTVLVGNTGYRGIRSIANEEGSDGTVRVSTANMNCVRLTASFPAHPEDPEVGHDVYWSKMEESTGSTAFGVLDGHNHGTIKLSHLRTRRLRSKRDRGALNDIIKSLTVQEDDFEQWREELAVRNEALLPSTSRGNAQKHGFQNTVVRVEDQYGVGVDDFLLEFYEKDDDRGRTAERFHRSAIRKVHKYRDDHSYRSVYIDCTRLAAAIDKVGEYLSMSLTAYPELDPPKIPVGFETIADEHIGGLRIGKEDVNRFFAPHRTALVSLQLERQQSPEVFALRDYP